MKLRRFKKRRNSHELFPDEILLDAENLPEFNTHQFEGRIEKPIQSRVIAIVGLLFLLIGSSFLYRIASLQVVNGDYYVEQTDRNRLRHSIIFSERGVIYDRNDVPLAWNLPPEESSDHAVRRYIEKDGFAHILGYITYPKKDKAGFYYEKEYIGHGGAEEYFNDELAGGNGVQIVEVNALGDAQAQNVIRRPEQGENITLSIDSRLQEELYSIVKDVADSVGFTGGAAVMMDVRTGELITVVSYPEYNSNVMSDGSDVEMITNFLNDKGTPFINRAFDGLYTPGSIVKPFMASGILNEDIIDPTTKIVSTGSLKVPNPFNPGQYSLFNDWKAHGAVNIQEAIAHSSNVYFYVTGGGFGNQEGLGIEKINRYLRMFGLGEQLSDTRLSEKIGTIPSPEWKSKVFPDDPWRVGDTYYTSIGQYGFQVTPLQMVRALSVIATGGIRVEPTLHTDQIANTRRVDEISSDVYTIVRDGMRGTVTYGTAQALNLEGTQVSAKTGTAELGLTKKRVNSWLIGFFPSDEPKYVFAIIMESGPRETNSGAVTVMRRFLEWLKIYTPEYL